MRDSTQRTLICAVLLATSSNLASGQRFWALMRDGKIQTGGQLKYFDDPKQSVALDGRKLLGIEHPVRTIRDTKLSTSQPREFLKLVNGDLLAGQVVATVTGQAATPRPDHLVVENVPHTGSVRVRLDWVCGIVTSGRLRAEGTPNFLRLTNGSERQFRSIRWTPTGIKALTDDGVLTAAFNQIAELHVSQPQLPMYPGAPWLSGEGPTVVRIVSGNGQAISIPLTMVTKDFDKKQFGIARSGSADLFLTRPPWSIDSLLVDLNDIAWQSYFEAGEIPLSLLPVVDAVQKAGLHHYAWRRGRNVHGGMLHSGEIVSELGIGMHAYTRLTFELPPQAKTFSSRVGLNRLMGSGGCVHCRVWRDEPTGAPLWERRFLRGSDGLQQVGPLEISDAKQLILEVDFANEQRPHGADPLDIRDSVDWLLPIVQVEPAKDRMKDVAQVIPEIAGWSIPPDQLKQIKLRPAWVKRNNQWGTAIVTGSEPLVLSQQTHVTPANGWLPVRGTCDDVGANRMVWVQADGEKVASTMNGNLGTFSRYRFDERVYNLSGSAGTTAIVEVVADAHKKSGGELGGVVFDWLALQPVIENLPSSGQPIQPDVPLTSLSPISAEHRGKPIKLLPDKLIEGKALNLQDWHFQGGYGVPSDSAITFDLDPLWREFVAVIGLPSGFQNIGPYQILLDGQLHWASERSYSRNDPGEQISVPIPSGHKTMTLKLLGKNSCGVWAEAGFLK